jgi:hypothetical protein
VPHSTRPVVPPGRVIFLNPERFQSASRVARPSQRDVIQQYLSKTYLQLRITCIKVWNKRYSLLIWLLSATIGKSGLAGEIDLFSFLDGSALA